MSHNAVECASNTIVRRIRSRGSDWYFKEPAPDSPIYPGRAGLETAGFSRSWAGNNAPPEPLPQLEVCLRGNPPGPPILTHNFNPPVGQPPPPAGPPGSTNRRHGPPRLQRRWKRAGPRESPSPVFVTAGGKAEEARKWCRGGAGPVPVAGGDAGNLTPLNARKALPRRPKADEVTVMTTKARRKSPGGRRTNREGLARALPSVPRSERLWIQRLESNVKEGSDGKLGSTGSAKKGIDKNKVGGDLDGKIAQEPGSIFGDVKNASSILDDGFREVKTARPGRPPPERRRFTKLR